MQDLNTPTPHTQQAATSRKITATAGRLDSVLAEQLSQQQAVSRSQVAQWIAAGLVQVAGVVQRKASLKLRGGELLQVQVPPPAAAQVLPEELELEVLYEDTCLIAINKPAGMITHPAPGVTSGTLVNALLGRMQLPLQDDYDSAAGYRPGIVHRLDKDTSGVIVVAKTVAAHAALAAAFKERLTKKTYLALAAGSWKASQTAQVKSAIGRHPVQRQRMTVGGIQPREAQTTFIPLSQHRDTHGRTLVMVRAQPRTGRTHQIRVHLAHLGSPIIGDSVYGRSSQIMARQALHAHALAIPHPQTGEALHIVAPAPSDILEAWVSLGGQMPSNLEQV